MFTRKFTITTALFCGAALAVLSAGCSSSSRGDHHARKVQRDSHRTAKWDDSRRRDREHTNYGDQRSNRYNGDHRSNRYNDDHRSNQNNDDRRTQGYHDNRRSDRGASDAAPAHESSFNGSDDSITRNYTIGEGIPDHEDRVTMVSEEAPPLTLVEVPSHDPTAGEFWVPGHWRGESEQFVWQSGRVEHDRAGQLYGPAGWIPSSHGWEYTPEYWR
jgi:hypothetical protein